MGRFSFVIIFCIVFLGIIISTAKGQTSSSCLDLSQEFSNSGCVSDLNNLRREGSSNAACTGRCRELINSLFDCGTDSINTYTRQDVNDFCGSSGAASSARGSSFLMFLLAIAVAMRFVF